MKNKMMNYYRIRDIVSDVYIEYIYEQSRAYKMDDKYGYYLAEESMLLILDILNNNPELSREEIRDIAIREANIDRIWQ